MNADFQVVDVSTAIHVPKMLPSDIARLVLVYLRDEGLTRSYRQFFKDSPNLEELRRHSDVEPTVPFEKTLPEILNEYVKLTAAVKDRMNCNQLVSSLWKVHSDVISQLRFHYTANAGLIVQKSPEQRCTSQSAVTRIRMLGLRKHQELQRKLATQPSGTLATSSPSTPNPTTSSSYSAICSAQSDTNHAHMPESSSHIAINPTYTFTAENTFPLATGPVYAVDANYIPQNGVVTSHAESTNLSPDMNIEVDTGTGDEMQQNLIVHDNMQETVVIPEFRTPSKNPNRVGSKLNTPTGKSPKRKSAAPRKMPAITASISPRSEAPSSENQWDEDGRDLPEVIESFINNIEFQEKLASNINKARPVENSDSDKRPEPIREANSSHNSQSTTSLDELLNLNMSDDTIHDIIEKTSSDPAFESLFAIFSQNSQDNVQQPAQTDENSNPPQHIDDNTTNQSPPPATPYPSQSQCLSDQDPGHVISLTASENAQDMVTLSEPEQILSAVTTNTTNDSQGPTNSTSNSLPIASMSNNSMVQIGDNTQPTTSVSTDTPSGQPTSQVATVPLLLPKGATIFMSPDGRILGTSGVWSQSGQLLQTRNVSQVVTTGHEQNSGTVSSGGLGSTVAPSSSDICPVHGRKSAQHSAGNHTGGAISSPTPSADASENIAQTSNARGQSEVMQLLGTMVESDVGSLFDCSPQKSSSQIPERTKSSGSKPGQPTQTICENRNVFSAISGDHQASSPSRNSNQRNSNQQKLQGQANLAEKDKTQTPGNAVKQRKHIQFKEPVLPRTLDIGGPSDSPLKSRPTRAKAGQRSKTATKSKTQSRKNAGAPLASSSSDYISQKIYTPNEVFETSQSANQLVSEDMSTEVNLAAQMLVSLSNSPPSKNLSPYRIQRLRRDSGHSPMKSPQRDHIFELRKQIGLSPRNSTTKNASNDNQSVEVGKTGGSRRDDTQEASNSTRKRKSRTPRKQTQTETETVVLAVPPQKSKTPVTSSIQTRASSQKAKSPNKVLKEPVTPRKTSRGSSKSPGKSNQNSSAKSSTSGNLSGISADDVGAGTSRGQKRSREDSSKSEKSKKSRATKNSKKSKKSQGFPSNLDVDKFLSSLQYAE